MDQVKKLWILKSKKIHLPTRSEDVQIQIQDREVVGTHHGQDTTPFLSPSGTRKVVRTPTNPIESVVNTEVLVPKEIIVKRIQEIWDWTTHWLHRFQDYLKTSPCPVFSRETSKSLSPSSCCSHTPILYHVWLLSFVQDRISCTDHVVNNKLSPQISEADKTSLEIQDWIHMSVIPSNTVIGKNEDGSVVRQVVQQRNECLVLVWHSQTYTNLCLKVH